MNLFVVINNKLIFEAIDSYFPSSSTDGNWGQWEPWSDCDPVPNAKKCMRKRTRYCTDPPPKGEGKYCSLDGSSCEENERCFDCFYGNDQPRNTPSFGKLK